ncbi:MFS transporter [Achromobacter deleyi]|uniref:MFS transporter n=1 Tax=Achromobacter deleyi TaxID=1353891 RepID=A0A7T4B7V5_9BURK|nr:MFS transporter [Achromobacter deleyi]QQB37202.1 MFS transporter [Achromobacter deleyi]
MTQFALLWWIADTTGSAAAISAAALAALLPRALLFPVSRALMLRHGLRLPTIIGSLVVALLVPLLMLLMSGERIELWHAYATMALLSALQAFQRSADDGDFSILVPGGLVARGAKRGDAAQRVSLVVAAPLGAFLLHILAPGQVMASAVSTALLGLVPLVCFDGRRKSSHAVRGKGPWEEFRKDASLSWHTQGLRQLCVMLGAMALVTTAAFALMPLLVKDHFGGGAGQFAWLQVLTGMGIGLGRLLMAAMAPRRSVRWVLGGFSVCSVSIVLAAMAPSGLFGVAAAWWVMCGITFAFGVTPVAELLRAATPIHLRRRALSGIMAIVALAAPLGLVVAGGVGEWLGIRAVFVMIGLVGLGTCLAGGLSSSLAALDEQGT